MGRGGVYKGHRFSKCTQLKHIEKQGIHWTVAYPLVSFPRANDATILAHLKKESIQRAIARWLTSFSVLSLPFCKVSRILNSVLITLTFVCMLLKYRHIHNWFYLNGMPVHFIACIWFLPLSSEELSSVQDLTANDWSWGKRNSNGLCWPGGGRICVAVSYCGKIHVRYTFLGF